MTSTRKRDAIRDELARYFINRYTPDFYDQIADTMTTSRNSLLTFFKNDGLITYDLLTPSNIKRAGFKNKLLLSLQDREKAVFAITTSVFNPNIDVYEINESKTDFKRKTIIIHEPDIPQLPQAPQPYIPQLPEAPAELELELDETGRNLERDYARVYWEHYTNYPNKFSGLPPPPPPY